MSITANRAAFLLLVLGVSGPALAGQTTGEVAGVVRTRGGELVSGARVVVSPAGVEATADGAGRYVLVLLPGPHVLLVSAEGYEPTERVVVVPSGGRLDVDLVLEPTSRFSDEVTVSAVRAETRTPITKTDVSREEIASADHGQEMPFLLKQLPALTQYSDTGLGSGYSYIYLRGIPQTRMNITLDGAPLNEAEDSALYFVDFGDFASSVQSIQVQRGVGTSTVGAASFVGSVNFASLDFAERPVLAVRLTGGSFGTGRASVAGQSGAVGPGIKLYGRAAWQDTDGFRERSGVEQKSVFFGASRQEPRSFWKIFGFVGQERTELAFLAADVPSLEQDLRVNPLAPEERDAFGQRFVQGQYHHAIGATTEMAVQAYYNGAGGHYRLWNDPATHTALLEYGLDWRMAGAALSLRQALGGVALTWGLHANDFRSEHTQDVVGGSRTYVNHGNKNEANAFAKLAYDTGRWHHYADAQVRSARFGYEGSQDLGTVAWTFFNPKVGTRCDLAPGWSVYASVGRGGREPGRMDMLSGEDNATVPHDLDAVRPEHVVDVEGGLEYRASTLAIQGNAYWMEFRDEIALTGELSEIGLPLRRNVDRSYRRGVEIDASWRPAPSFGVRHTASIIRSRIDTWTQFYDVYDEAGGFVASVPRAHRDVPPLLTPAYVGNLIVDWTPTPSLSFSGLGRYVSRAFLDNTETDTLTTPDHFTLDLSATVGLRGLLGAGAPVLRLFVNNVLDADRVFPSGYSYQYLVRGAGGRDTWQGIPYYYPLATRHAFVAFDWTLAR